MLLPDREAVTVSSTKWALPAKARGDATPKARRPTSVAAATRAMCFMEPLPFLVPLRKFGWEGPERQGFQPPTVRPASSCGDAGSDADPARAFATPRGTDADRNRHPGCGQARPMPKSCWPTLRI